MYILAGLSRTGSGGSLNESKNAESSRGRYSIADLTRRDYAVAIFRNSRDRNRLDVLREDGKIGDSGKRDDPRSNRAIVNDPNNKIFPT